MLNSETINDLNKAFKAAPGGFLVVDSGQPRFAVLDYKTYASLKNLKQAKMQVKTILVTGGAGYIGAVTTRVLQQKGYEVIVYDNLSTGRKERVSGAKLVEADLADRTALAKVFREQQIDAVIHFAASIEVEESVKNPAKYFENNVVNGLNLLSTMLENRVVNLVFSSSAGVYGEPKKLPITEDVPCVPTNPYGETKVIFEKILKWYGQAYGLRSISLRYFNAAGAWPEEKLGYNNLTGNETHLIPRVLYVAEGKAAEIMVFGQDYDTSDRTCIRDYIHVRDLVDVHILALQKLPNVIGAEVYNVGSGKGFSVCEVIDEAVEVTERMIPMKFAPRRPGDPAKLIADSTKLQKEFNWQPKFDLRTILESSWQWHKMNK